MRRGGGVRLTVTLDVPDDALDEVVDRLAERLGPILSPPEADRWLDAEEAAAYLGFDSVSPLDKIRASRQIEFSQARPGAKTWFRRSALDDFRERFLLLPRE